MNRRPRAADASSASAAPSKSRQQAILKSFAIPLAIGLLGLLGLSLMSGDKPRVADREEPTRASEPERPPRPAESAATPAAKPEFSVLQGQWVRDDGGYVLMLKKVEPDGTLEATYFNPRPIHVAKAQASQADEQLKLFVELRDEGYPGCTYNLTYDPQREELHGSYYQAAMQETYEVVFRRGQ